ncbi:MAG: hypothetical protein WDO14_24015 [Bacteroidota bacterium]
MSLEKFIKEHRDEFDDKEPSERVWKNIARKQTTIISALSIWRAAAVIFFGLSVYLFVVNRPAVSKREIASEFKDIEMFYGDQIAEKVALIEKLEGYDDDQFSQDVKKLDAMYEVLREEMKTSPSAKVKDALILNMLVRIDLLNQQIQKLEDHRKTDEDQKEI